MNVKTIRFPLKTDEKLKKIAFKLGRTKVDTFMQMVDYFYSCKKDPNDINDELLKNTLLKNHKDYIGFIKTQESELLIPIKRDADRMIKGLQLLTNHFTEDILVQNRKTQDHQQHQKSESEENRKLMIKISQSMSTKENLKSQFLYIFNNYVTARDAFGMMTSAKDKAELSQTTIANIKML
ncbi:BfmA/BtgA family mobilization protein [Pedobacter arcticus]|uniref:BfmA/BtgA family mobilization protein n=1 Tax=Pedobacter arcticus TaxID=752140 RepID=UPI0003132EF9|nr:BfmA/BtgA family mobilization protein [Pedobacter arcticus]